MIEQYSYSAAAKGLFFACCWAVRSSSATSSLLLNFFLLRQSSRVLRLRWSSDRICVLGFFLVADEENSIFFSLVLFFLAQVFFLLAKFGSTLSFFAASVSAGNPFSFLLFFLSTSFHQPQEEEEEEAIEKADWLSPPSSSLAISFSLWPILGRAVQGNWDFSV